MTATPCSLSTTRRRPPRPASLPRDAAADAPAIHALIDANLDAGHLLPRTRDDLATHADAFVVVAAADTVVGCAELAPLSRAVAEVRSLVVDATARPGPRPRSSSRSCGPRAPRRLPTLCAFTHEPSHFVRLGFSIVPHVWFPEKIAIDCTGCPQFRSCGQVAVALPLARASLAAGGQSPAAGRRRAGRDDAARPHADGHATITPSPGASRLRRASAPPASRAASRRPARLDLALIVADGRASAPRVFTTNRRWRRRSSCRASISPPPAAARAAIVVNSGCANACTGRGRPRGRAADGGRDAARRRLRRPRKCSSRRPASLAWRSTPRQGHATASSPASRRCSADGHADAARAIMTTDPFPKEHAVARRDAPAACSTSAASRRAPA